MAKIRKFAVFILTSFLTLSFSHISNAQESYYEERQRTFVGGLLLGTNFTQVDGDRYAGYHNVGINAGGIMYMYMGEKLAASIELLYSQKGAKSNQIQTGGTVVNLYDYSIKLNYAEVPIMLNYFDRRKSHFGAGFSYGQLISSKETVSSGTSLDSTDFDKKYPFRKFDIDFVLSGNLHLKGGFFLNYHFQYSIVSIRSVIDPQLGRHANPDGTGAQQFNNMHVLRLMYLF
jgi:hypothetical protein